LDKKSDLLCVAIETCDEDPGDVLSHLYKVRIAGTGRYLPDRLVTNEDLTKRLDTTDEWITQRTGIKTRHYADEGDSTARLGAEAGRKAMKAANIGAEDVDLILFATVTPDYRLPFCASLAQRHLEIPNAMGYDVSSGCAGYVQATQTACQFIHAGAAKTALVIGADIMTSIIDPMDRGTAVLFGDAGGAVVLTRAPEDADCGLLAMTGGLQGNDEVLVIPTGGSKTPITKENFDERGHYVVMKGRDVFRFAVDRFSSQIKEACDTAGIKPSELKIVVPHQVNRRIIESAVRRCDIPLERVILNLDRYGNTSGATVPMALDEAIEGGRIERGDYFIMVAFGSGLAWASALFRY
jgi:3-oxoacyl-[acyl-carrier-protein] synthase III